MKIIGDLKHKAFCYYEKTDCVSIAKVLLRDGTSAVVLFRLAKFFQSIGLALLGYIVLDINKFLNGCVLGLNTDFDEGFVLMHPVGVVINGAVKGGKNIVLQSSVVIGAAHNGPDVAVPTFADNISIGSGAKILGGIKIGRDVKIGANAVVVKEVPNGATVVGIPARAIRLDNPSSSSQ